MKIRNYLFLLILFLQSCSVSNINSKSIFRYVNLYQYGKIELGNSIHQYKHLTVLSGNRYFLKENVFGGAESIELVINKQGLISEIVFKYDQEVSMESQISSYSYLGKPIIKNKNAIWNDGKTSFVLFENRGIVYSKMSDLKNL